jgi:predicted nucleic acid-binding protein
MAQIVIADASPIIILAQIGGLDWLVPLFGKVWLTEIVRDEILPGGKPGEKAILEALASSVLVVIDKDWPKPQFPELDEGEASTIRAALNLPEKCLLLMDERLGRMVAQENGLSVAGVAGLIGMSKKRGLIPSASAVFEQLLQTDFRISPDLIRSVLLKVGE